MQLATSVFLLLCEVGFGWECVGWCGTSLMMDFSEVAAKDDGVMSRRRHSRCKAIILNKWQDLDRRDESWLDTTRSTWKDFKLLMLMIPDIPFISLEGRFLSLLTISLMNENLQIFSSKVQKPFEIDQLTLQKILKIILRRRRKPRFPICHQSQPSS